MPDLAGIFAITFIFGGAALIGLAHSPVGKALAERIRGRGSQAGHDDRSAHLEQELHDVRTDLAELEERLDFTERLIARGNQDQSNVSK